jgi:hypothetical protein
MDAEEYDETDMTPEEFEEAMAAGTPADVLNLAEHVMLRRVDTTATAETHNERLSLVGEYTNVTIKERLELAGT